MLVPQAVRIGSRRVPISITRRFVIDLLHFAKKVPTLPMQRTMQLDDVIEAREQCGTKVSWCAIFIRAYGILAERHPELRRTYVPIPWPHFYEHSVNVASFSVEREYRGEMGVFFGQIAAPEQRAILAIDRKIRELKEAPIESVPNFRAALRLSRVPAPFRRFVWWLGLNDGAAKARFFGTFGISVVASFGAASLTLLTPLTTTINYGVFRPDGSIDVRLMYDHRVMDGAFVARCIAELERILHTEIVDELRSIQEKSAGPRILEVARKPECVAC